MFVLVNEKSEIKKLNKKGILMHFTVDRDVKIAVPGDYILFSPVERSKKPLKKWNNK
ncbi:hypothetical protein A3Q56_03905 [Intoshia linei]|uniref:Uncharacterized protein n=1 Tax=Intoshia linei TaxID=1819745 RepID=A0A177B271_9BILA|nr:hypothetical protein A3Q56_03905 [Intoshia linei]